MKEISKYRKEIDKININIIKLLKKRENTVLNLSKIKKKNNLKPTDIKREKEIYNNIEKESIKQNLNLNYAKKIFKIIFNFSRNIQKK